MEGVSSKKSWCLVCKRCTGRTWCLEKRVVDECSERLTLSLCISNQVSVHSFQVHIRIKTSLREGIGTVPSKIQSESESSFSSRRRLLRLSASAPASLLRLSASAPTNNVRLVIQCQWHVYICRRTFSNIYIYSLRAVDQLE